MAQECTYFYNGYWSKHPSAALIHFFSINGVTDPQKLYQSLFIL